MNKAKLAVTTLLLMVLVAFVTEGTGEKALIHARGDLTGEGKHLVVLNGVDHQKYMKEIVIYDSEAGKREVFRKDISYLNPWKLEVGDVDGDGRDEISIGVYKKSPLHPVMAKRPFFYNFDGQELIPKWRGSRLSRPFEDYTLYDIEGDGIMEVVAVEYLQDDTQLLHSYKWREFGFEGHMETEAVASVENLFEFEDKLYAIVKEGEDNIRYQVTQGEEELEWREYND